MKNYWISLCTSASLILATAALVPQAKADEWDKQTKVTFNNPVEIPGMVLGPGTYTLKLLDSPSTRDVVEVMNAEMTHLYRFVMAIPVYRMEPADHTVITFQERAAGAPQAIKDWYYPGDLRGEEFLFGKTQRVMTSAAPAPPTAVTASAPTATPTAAAAAPSAQAAPAPQQSAAVEQESTVEVAQATPPPAQNTPAQNTLAQNTPTQNTPTQNTPQQLPKTASDLPLLGLLGGFSLSAGLCLRRRDA